jgi:geranylgeranyl diphosphate synthase type I
MNLSEYLTEKRSIISSSIKTLLTDNLSDTTKILDDKDWLLPILTEYAISGKMLRGSLVYLGYDLFHDKLTHRETKRYLPEIAAALELLQAGLLVHDDIMDKDDIRRGKPTLHKLFGTLEEKHADEYPNEKALSPSIKTMSMLTEQTGEAMGICVGDIYYFIALKAIARFSFLDPSLFPDELIKVCLAQMRDVRMGNTTSFPSLDEVLAMYKYKTARYTISLPLTAGASAAGADSRFYQLLNDFGENLGIVFQLQDDSLGLFGNASQLGKPVGSDIREGKKTPHMILLTSCLDPMENDKFRKIFGNPGIDLSDIDYIRDLVIRHGVDSRVDEIANGYGIKAKNILSQIEFPSNTTDLFPLRLLEEFVDYSFTRAY